MNKRHITILVLTSFLFCESCTHHTTYPIPNSGITVSGCISDNYKTSDPCPTFVFADGVLEIMHLVTLNCASSIIAVESYCNNNTITINYQTDGNDSANCICDKEVHYYLQGVSSGTYMIIISIDGSVIYQQKHRIV